MRVKYIYDIYIFYSLYLLNNVSFRRSSGSVIAIASNFHSAGDTIVQSRVDC